MKELLQTIAAELVNDPEQINIKEIEQGNTTVLELSVAPEDMGKVIGRKGRRAQAIRSVMKAKAIKDGRKIIVDIVD